MRTKIALALSAAALLLAVVLPIPAAPGAHQETSGTYKLQVAFDVDAEKGSYRCRAEVIDLVLRQVVFAPSLVAKIGDEAVAKTGVVPVARPEVFELRVSATENVATYAFSVTRSGRVVTEQAASIAF